MTDSQASNVSPPSVCAKVLVANRGEIACRVIRAAAERGARTVAVAPSDDQGSLHVRLADECVTLAGRGAAAYLDIAQIVSSAVDHGCTAVHPGYGFLSENAEFAEAVEAAGLAFIGPTPEVLRRFGDKAAARELAAELGVPTLAGSGVLTSAEEAAAFVETHGAAMLKAVAGGGGRGMRAVTEVAAAAEAFERCSSEASAAFGLGDVYAEQLVADPRHIEVQVVGDSQGEVAHLWERECTLQRQNQKIVELAPAPDLAENTRHGLLDAAVALARAVGYRSLGTFEFLVDRTTGAFYFIEANARIQVEHTVTEEITGIDLVHTQLAVAEGASLSDLDLTQAPAVVGQAVQLRVNTETMQADGTARPTGGTLSRFEIPSGRGVRTDTYGYTGYTTSPAYDSLLAKVIVHVRTGGLPAAYVRAGRALAEFRIEGVATNSAFLAGLISEPLVVANDVNTGTVAALAPAIVARVAATEAEEEPAVGGPDDGERTIAGKRVDASDPLAVLALGKERTERAAPPPDQGPSGAESVNAPLQGTIVSMAVDEGDEVVTGTQLLVMEAMKMEHVVSAPASGVVRRVNVEVGDAVFEGHPLVFIEQAEVSVEAAAQDEDIDLDHIRPDLAEALDRHAYGYDERRPEAVEKRHATGRRTVRENVADLVDDGTFTEWGPLMVAAQRKRRSLQELIEKTPADGLVGGIGTVNGELFGDRATTMVVSYDYMVLAGTQGHNNHRKKDRLFELASRLRTPVVLFAEGGGGRPGDTEGTVVAGLDGPAFTLWAELSGKVPLVGINGGYCFAGNAALLGCCDVIISTRDSYLGMGGPAMIEGGGLGVFHPTEVGPVEVQEPNGVIDLLVADEAEAVQVAKQYLSYFQGALGEWETHDQRRLRHLIPENRLRIYDVRQVIETTFDVGSVLELRKNFGLGMITALARIEGRPVGVIANNPVHLAGAIDSEGADKAARFMQLCDAFDVPIVNFCDTPGIMVGPEVEKTALVRHASRMFVTGANVDVPMCTIVLRKGYGLGAQAMAGGDFKAGVFTVGWPTSEFGGMGLEGAVKLGYRNELAAIEDPAERMAEFDKRVARMYEVGKGVSLADHFEIDDVIDPMDTRRWIMTMLTASEMAGAGTRSGRKRSHIDTW